MAAPWSRICWFVVAVAIAAAAQAQSAPKANPGTPNRTVLPATPPPDYVIGPDDVLSIVFPYEKDLSSDVAVRPDGKISLPLMNDIQAVGLTPEQLRVNIASAAARFVQQPTVTVVVKEINSRKVFIMGQVGKPGAYPLHGPTTVLQLIATAGGLLDYADSKNISIVRSENGSSKSLVYNHKEVVNRKNLKQNIELEPGDTVIVP